MLTPRDARRGFTLVELLVVIAIIGILVSLLLPAVQSAREAGRRTQCANNLRNLGLAAIQHEGKFKKFPTGGWGERWVGDPNEGNAEKQSGGWVYNILPFIEQEALHDVGLGLTAGTAQMQAANAQRINKTLALMMCPSRGRPPTFSAPSQYPFETASGVSSVARGDYAANAGVRYYKASANATENAQALGCSLDSSDYPQSLNDVSGFSWKLYRWTGVSFQRSGVSSGAVRDGMTYTYLIGEKYLDPRRYDDGSYPGDDGTVLGGMGNDNYRTTYVAPQSGNTDLSPAPGSATATPSFQVIRNDGEDNTSGADCQCTFGGPHSGIVQFVFCDGSVRNISTSIDAFTHRYLGERADKEILDDSQLQ
jgi:prepilin-type N-terminal cleavage/methylation domain-containing protein